MMDRAERSAGQRFFVAFGAIVEGALRALKSREIDFAAAALCKLFQLFNVLRNGFGKVGEFERENFSIGHAHHYRAVDLGKRASVLKGWIAEFCVPGK